MSFLMLFCYQKSFESGEMAVLSRKNCQLYNQKVLEKAYCYFWSLDDLKSVDSSIEVPMFGNWKTETQTHKLITVTLCSIYMGEG